MVAEAVEGLGLDDGRVVLGTVGMGGQPPGGVGVAPAASPGGLDLLRVFRLYDPSPYPFCYLWHYGVSEASKSLHVFWNPIIHSTKVGAGDNPVHSFTSLVKPTLPSTP